MKKIKMWKFTPVLALVPLSIAGSLLIHQTPSEIERTVSDPNFEIENDRLVVANELGRQQTHLEIPDGVTSIQENAFKNCSSLQSIVIPKTVTFIAANAFENCPHLTATSVINYSPVLFNWWVNNYDYHGQSLNQMTEIDLSKFTNCDGKPFTIISEKAFSHARNLVSIKIPKEITRIEANAFQGVNQDIKYYVPNEHIRDSLIHTNISADQIIASNEYFTIQGNTLVGLTELGKAKPDFLAIPYGVTSISANAFDDCEPKKIMLIPDWVTNIDQNAFKNFSRSTKYYVWSETAKKTLMELNIENQQIFQVEYNFLVQDGRLTGLIDGSRTAPNVTIPSDIHTIDFAAFWFYDKLETINIPESVTSINSSAFIGCTALKNVNLPNNLKWIGIGAFGGCESLKEIVIPENVTHISSNVFQNCTNLENVTNNSPVLFDWWIKNHQYGDKTLSQMKEINLGKFTNSNAKPFTIIGDGAFQNCDLIHSVTIPNNIEIIPNHAFNNCSALKNVSIPPSVKRIDNFAFTCCGSLSNVNIFSKDIAIGPSAFFATPKTAKFYVYHPETKQALMNADIKEEQIVLIDHFVFEHDKVVGLTEEGNKQLYLIIPHGVTAIGANAFSSNPSLTNIAIPKSVIDIHDEAFKDCPNLRLQRFVLTEEYR